MKNHFHRMGRSEAHGVSRAWIAVVGIALGLAGLAQSADASAGLISSGNTDGVLTWRMDDLEPGQSARAVVLLAFDRSVDAARLRLDQARAEFTPGLAPRPATGATEPTVWLTNHVTDFALQGPGHFFWEGQRQSLRSADGGQLSRLGYYLHYDDHHAGTPITRQHPLENLRVIEPMRRVDDREAAGIVATTDGKLRVQIRARLGEGTVAAVEFVLNNTGESTLRQVALSVYANLEAAHDHENDYGVLDHTSAALLTVDAATGRCALMSGLHPPDHGHSGVWASQEALRIGVGVPFAQWAPYRGIPTPLQRALTAKRGGIYDDYAPAPPLEPSEPETRDLTVKEAEAVLRQDWLFQAEGQPLNQRAKQEIGWARALAHRLAANPHTPSLEMELRDLDALAARLDQASANVSGQELYFDVRAVKRRVQFKNPVIDFSQVLFIDNPYPQGREWQHQVRHRNGMMAVPGGRLLVLDGLSPAGQLRKLAPDRPASFWRPDLSFDGRRVLFCMKRHDEKSFHLYEVNFDGSGLRQITEGPYDDLDPIYLPSGQIMFSTTRGNTYIRCMPYTYSYILGRCDADGSNLYLISQSSEPEWLPTLLNDGRVLFSRWDYIDKALWRIQSLWTIRQDGTGVETFWGNQSVWPDHQAEARPIPGSERVMFTGLAHHDWFAGSIGMLDRGRGRNFPDGLTKVTADVAWPECGNGPVDPVEGADYHTAGKFDAYKSPYPLSEEDFLVSARRDGKFRLYLMDVHGNRELIYEGAHHIWHAMPVRPRPRPPQHTDLVAWPGVGPERTPPQPGVFYNANVCQGVPDLPAERVKFLRVLQMEHKTYSLWTRDARFSGPAISPLQDDGVKRILGTVPVEADGSVYFKAPPNVVLYFQLLDERKRALQTMRSSCGVMPGETRSCIGCHEQHSTAPANTASLALRREPAELTPPPWGKASLSYERLVQPVLDRYCGRCHQGAGEGRAQLDLTLRPGQGPFKEPYLTLVGPIGFGLNHQPHTPGLAGALMCENFDQNDPASYGTLRPLRHLSYTSRLIDLCLEGRHYDVRLDDTSLQTLIGWVDANCPYRGDEDVRAIPDPAFAGVEDLPIRPRTKTAPVIERP